MSVTIKVRNKDRLYRKLRSTVPGINKELKSALAKSGDELVDKARSFVPVDDGDLRDSIQWQFDRRNSKEAFGKSFTREAPGIFVSAGDEKAFYAPWVEHGTVRTPKQPFFFPAYRLLKRKIKSRLSRAMTKAIKKAGFGKK